MRTVLTMLGVIIGVAAVIAMMEISQGASVAIQTTVTNMGANTLMVTPRAPKSGSSGLGERTDTISPEDADAIARDCPSVVCTAPIVNAWEQAVYGNRSTSERICVTGSTPAFLTARNWTDLDLGRVFTDREVTSGSKVCLIGQTLVRQLFGNKYPVGEEIRVKNVPFRVIGVLSEKGANLLGSDQDNIVFAPWTTVKYRISGGGGGLATMPAKEPGHGPPGRSLADLLPGSMRPTRSESVQQVMVKAKSPEAVAKASDEITQMLRQRHRLANGENDFRIYDMAEVSNAFKRTIYMLSGLGMSIAAVSLIVGGVGIMNIMLVSVTERTREIGLRMAVGADAKDILRQFLVEAVVLCLVGGFIGILAGRAGSLFAGAVMGWPTYASPSAAVVAVAVSVTVGVIFGYYPAWKASRLNPIDALRYEYQDVLPRRADRRSHGAFRHHLPRRRGTSLFGRRHGQRTGPSRTPRDAGGAGPSCGHRRAVESRLSRTGRRRRRFAHALSFAGWRSILSAAVQTWLLETGCIGGRSWLCDWCPRPSRSWGLTGC